MTTTSVRKSVSIHDYPEHLNPFREDDNNKMKFWTIGKRLNRSNSISFSGIKDFRNSWALRSFMKKGKKKEPPPPPPEQENKTGEMNGDSSPIVFRRALQYSSTSTAARSTVGAPERYVYGGSVTPLPRSRFQERLRSSSQQEVSGLSTPRMARSEVSGSRFSVESTNPFEDVAPIPPVRAPRRKKKKAPAPPAGTLDSSFTSETSELQTTVENATLETSAAEDSHNDKSKKPEGDLEIEEMNLDVELKIVEDEDVKVKHEKAKEELNRKEDIKEITENKSASNQELKEPASPVNEVQIKNVDSLETILNSVEFPKVDIVKYRRNSSVNEDDIRLRRGNLEDFHALSCKRSKSLTNALDSSYVAYDINLNEKDTVVDANGNNEPQKVICKLYDDSSRKQSIDTVSSTEKEFIEIDKVRREFESEINKLNAALEEDFSSTTEPRLSVSDIKRRFDKSDVPSSPNPIPKPRRSHYSDSSSPVNGNV